MRTKIVPLGVLALTLIGAATVAAQTGPADPPDSEWFADQIAGLEWREIGPANMGGRVSAIVGVPGNPRVFWVGGADGGVFKTTNAGTTFTEQFTDQPVYSVGALALASSDHNVLWLGSGEGDPRNSVSYGDGVYRSTDGGDSWTHLGLDATERIKRIAVHPGDSDVAWVCAMGREWGPNPERGVFRTRDGGVTWDHVLSIDDDTGCSDIDIDLSNPRVLYAGMWTFRRRPWRFDDGGRETALYKTTDGGDNWTKLEGNGLPKGPMARIGVQVAQSDADVVYLVTEAKDEGILWRSDDAGENWRMVHADARINFRPFYYSDIRVDPTNPNTLYSLSGGLYKSIDGGRTFERIAGGVHGDHQSYWIDPEDSKRILSGSDGGYQVSFDAGATWDIINNVTLSQFYQIFYDMAEPYNVCGGLQDNGSWCGPSRTTHNGGILKDDWYRVSGGDGFYAIPIPDEPHLIYTNLQGGVFMLTDMRSGGTRRIHPYPNRIGSAGDAMLGHKYRFNWDAPIHISPHDSKTVYIGGNHVHRSTDYGMSWEEISPDLTTADTVKQLTSGGEIYQDNTAAEFHTTLLTIAESPVQAGIIWAGSDDGLIHVTRDGGGSWTDVTANVPGLPAFAWIAKIDASVHDACTAFVAVDNHRLDDFAPHAWRTTDCGESWTDLSAGMPQDDYVKVIRQDPRNPNLLYAGMERGIIASWDGGQSWASIRNGLPPVSVRDLWVHPRDHDLIIGTHGRGAYIMDDVLPLQSMDATQADVTGGILGTRPAVRWQTGSRDASMGQRTYRASNPPYGAYINYFLSETPEEALTITIKDSEGHVVREIEVEEPHAGMNRTVWDLRAGGPERAESQGGGGGGGGFGGGGGGPMVPPGRYDAELEALGGQYTTAITVRPDPRIDIPAADYTAQYEAALRLRELRSEANGMIDDAASLEKQLDDLKGHVAGADGGIEDAEAIQELADGAIEEIDAFQDDLLRPIPGLGYRQTPRLSEELRSLYGSVSGMASRPTEAELLRLNELDDETRAMRAVLEAIIAGKIAELNARLEAHPAIMVGRPPATS